MTADAGTHAVLIARLREDGGYTRERAADALEEADRQLAEAERERDRWREAASGIDLVAVARLEAALKTATDALEESWPSVENLRGYQHALTDGCDPSADRGRHFGAHLDAILARFREALAAIRQETGGLTGNMDRPFEDLAFGVDDDPLVPQAEDG